MPLIVMITIKAGSGVEGVGGVEMASRCSVSKLAALCVTHDFAFDNFLNQSLITH